MKRIPTVFLLLALTLIVCPPRPVHSQTPAPSTKAESSQARSRSWSRQNIVPSLLVMNARGASLMDRTLVLDGVSANAIVFADRPVRAAGHLLTSRVLDQWGNGGSFAKDPPNATVSVLSKEGTLVRDVVLELRNPRLQGGRLSFDVRVLEGTLAGADGPASIFIDTIGLAFPPVAMQRPLD
jgi:hypothetical protein